MNLDARLPRIPALWENDRLHFFKYMTASTAKIVLENRTLRWSTASELNDPFDMQFDMSVNVDRERLKARALEKIWSLYSGVQPIPVKNPMGAMLELLRNAATKFTKEELKEKLGPAIGEGYDRMITRLPTTHANAEPQIATLKILSLTTKPDNNLMWTHYTNAHSGVVMRFRSIPAFDSPYGMAKPMNYVSEVPPFYSENDLVDIIAGVAKTNARDIIEKIIYTKSADYEYEQEWRVSTGSGRNKHAPFEDVPFGLNELDGIIFGLRTSDADKTEIQELAAKYPNIEMMRSTRTRSSLTLTVETL